MYVRRSVNIAEKWALVADGGHGNDAPLADYAGRAGERGLHRVLGELQGGPKVLSQLKNATVLEGMTIAT